MQVLDSTPVASLDERTRQSRRDSAMHSLEKKRARGLQQSTIWLSPEAWAAIDAATKASGFGSRSEYLDWLAQNHPKAFVTTPDLFSGKGNIYGQK